MSKYNTKYTKELLSGLVTNCFSIADLLRKLNLKQSGSNHAHIRRRLNQYNIDTSHFTGSVHNKGKENPRLLPSDVLVFDRLGRREKPNVLRRVMIFSGILEKCAECNLVPLWNNKKLTLQIDHIDGNGLNNCIENLRFLCPNCHSQTETFGVRNIK